MIFFPFRERTMWPAALTLWHHFLPNRTHCVWATCWESKTAASFIVYFFFVFISSLFFANIWLCLTSITDTFEAFTLNLLSSLMITGPNSPFYKALIEPKIGTDFSPVVGFVLCTQIPVKMSWHSAEWHWWCLCVMFCTADMMAAPKKLRSVSASRGCPRRTWRQWKTLSTEP